MSENKKLQVMKVSWWLTLIAGVAIGVVSQRIPELKFYTDELVQPIEKTKAFKEMKAKISHHLHKDSMDIAHQQIPYSHFSEENSLPSQPLSSFVIHRSGYSVAYDARTRNPAWVYEHLTADNLKGDADRSHFHFKEDESIPQHLRATLADYKGQGLDQGHMAPAADHRANDDQMSETFYLTNMCPQCPQFNREYWAQIEKHIRELAKEHQHTYVVTGPLYLPYHEGKRRFVKYQVIGPNDVGVPSHFFKVITLEDEQGKREIRAYVLPNTYIPSDTPIDHFKTTAQKVEKAAGLILFNQ